MPITSALTGGLLDAASEPYRRAGLFAYHFARGKLRGDPVYSAILAMGLLQGRSRVLDLGCGQALLTSWLLAAEYCFERADWPASWPAPPKSISTYGIELMPRDVERARAALGACAQVLLGDIRTTAFCSADAVVILDVLHYFAVDSQQRILQRVRAALPVGGLLLLRVGNAAGGLRFHYGQWIDRIIMLARGHGWVRTHCRTLSQWQQLLHECYFHSRVVPMSEGTAFANFLLVARAR